MQSEKNAFSWSEFWKYRKQMRRTFRSVYRIEIRRKLEDVIAEAIKPGEKILDVGAGGRRLKEGILKRVPAVQYKSMDVDRTEEHDYYSLGEIKEPFDVIVMSEVIEHLSFDDGIKLLKELRRILRSGGRIIVTTPNTHHPNVWWSDSDHKTPYRFDCLGAALMEAGFRVKGMYRLHSEKFLKRIARYYLMAWLHRFLDVDFAKHIAAIAEKP